MVRISTMRTTVGIRFLYGYMKYDKLPIDLPQQLEKKLSKLINFIIVTAVTVMSITINFYNSITLIA